METDRISFYSQLNIYDRGGLFIKSIPIAEIGGNVDFAFINSNVEVIVSKITKILKINIQTGAISVFGSGLMVNALGLVSDNCYYMISSYTKYII
jgi:hypothetical protein